METGLYVTRPSKERSALSAEIQIGSESGLRAVEQIPELLAIDKEIGRPYAQDPLLYNSQAWSRKLELPWAVQRVGPTEGLSVLDVGSGISPLPIFLSRHGANVVSVEPETIDGLPESSVGRVRAALPRLPFRDGAFDIVCCVSVIEHIRGDLDRYFRELCRVSRRRVILTFDVAFGPFALLGLSMTEVRAFGRMLGLRVDLPPDRLKPDPFEISILGRQLGVCMLCVDRPPDGWQELRFRRGERLLTRLNRVIHRVWVRIWRRLRKARGRT